MFVDGGHELDEEETLRVISYTKTDFPLYGAIYSAALNMLVTWTGEASDHMFEVWDVETRKVRFKIKKHDYKILSVCEMVLDQEHPAASHFIASSSVDKKLLIWPTAPIASMAKRSNKMLRAADALGYELVGHTHAIVSLVYAPHHEVLIGAGFDYEIYAWDPFTRDICMKFVGHFKSMHSVQVCFIPTEKLVSIDETGVIKVWNIDKNLGLFGEQEQSLRVQLPSAVPISSFTAAFNNGGTLVVQAGQTYFFDIETETLDDLRPVPGGLGFSINSCGMWCVTKKTITSIHLLTGSILKRLAFLDQDRISSKEVIKVLADGAPSLSHAGEESHHAHGHGVIGGLHDHHDKKKVYKIGTSYLDSRDFITAMDQDPAGKKLFIGTNDGRVLLYDSFTFGLLLQLTDERDDAHFFHQGCVVALNYVARDELVVATYASGAVKVLVGCHRTQPATSQAEEAEYDKTAPYPCSGGGKPPSNHFLLREVDMCLVSDNSFNGACFSTDYNLIATCTKKGLIFVYDYIDLKVLSVLRVPHFEDQDVVCMQITFCPLAPVLLAIDNCGRVSAWSVRPMKFLWLHTWSVYHQLDYREDYESPKKDTKGLGGAPKPSRNWASRMTTFGSAQGASTIVSDANLPANGMQLTSIVCLCMPPIPKQKAASNSSGGAGSSAGAGAGAGADTKGPGAPAAFGGRMRMGSSNQFDLASIGKSDSIMSTQSSKGGAPMQRARSRRIRNSEADLERRRSVAALGDGDDEDGGSEERVDKKWVVVIGDEGGNVLLMDISRLIHKTGASSNKPRKGAHFPVYQRQRAIRMKPLYTYEADLQVAAAAFAAAIAAAAVSHAAAAVTGASNPSEEEEKSRFGAGHHTANSNSFDSSALGDTIGSADGAGAAAAAAAAGLFAVHDPHRISIELYHSLEHPVGSEVVLGDVIAAKTHGTAAGRLGGGGLASQPNMARKGFLLNYVQGFRRWVACPGIGVRNIAVIDKHTLLHVTHNSSPRHATTAQFKAGATAGTVHHTSHQHPQHDVHHPQPNVFDAVPAVLFLSSETGVVFKFSWEGNYLGQTKEESLDPRKSNEEEEDELYGELALKTAAAAAVLAQKNGLDVLENADFEAEKSSTFITSIITDLSSNGTNASTKKSTTPARAPLPSLNVDVAETSLMSPLATPGKQASSGAAASMGRVFDYSAKMEKVIKEDAQRRELETQIQEIGVVPVLRGQSVVSHTDLKPANKGFKGWKFPQISLCIRPFHVKSVVENSDPRIYHLQNVQHYALQQYNHQSEVLQWVVPFLQKALKRYNEVNFDGSSKNIWKTLSSTVGSTKFLSSSGSQRPMSAPTAASGKFNRLNSSKAIMTSKPSATLLKSSASFANIRTGGSTSPDLGTIDLFGLDDLDIPVRGEDESPEFEDEDDLLAAKQNKVNMNNLIDYIQDSTYFPPELKNGKSAYLRLHNLESEHLRKAKDKARKDPFKGEFTGYGIADFDRKNITGELAISQLNRAASSASVLTSSTPLLQSDESRKSSPTTHATVANAGFSFSSKEPTSSAVPAVAPAAAGTSTATITVSGLSASSATSFKSVTMQQQSSHPQMQCDDDLAFMQADSSPVNFATQDSPSPPGTVPVAQITTFDSVPAGGRHVEHAQGLGRHAQKHVRPMSAPARKLPRPLSASANSRHRNASPPTSEVQNTHILGHKNTSTAAGASFSLNKEEDGAFSRSSSPGKKNKNVNFSAPESPSAPVGVAAKQPTHSSVLTSSSSIEAAAANLAASLAFATSTNSSSFKGGSSFRGGSSLKGGSSTKSEFGGSVGSKKHADLQWDDAVEHRPDTTLIATSERLHSIVEKFSRAIALDAHAVQLQQQAVNDASAAATAATLANRRNTKGGKAAKRTKLYAALNASTYLSGSAIPGVVDVQQEEMKQEIKRNVKAANSFERGYYGPYKTKMLHMYITWIGTMQPVGVEECIAINPNIVTDIQLDASGPFEGQSRYVLKSLIVPSHDQAYQQVFVDPLAAFAKNYQHVLITDADIQSTIFENAQYHEKLRIYMLIKFARMFYAMMLQAVPSKEGGGPVTATGGVPGAAPGVGSAAASTPISPKA
jgi:WD40 repeat protein